MASVQDHTPLIKELFERRQQDPQPTQPQGHPKSRDTSDAPLPIVSEPPRESSPPQFSQLHDPSPEATESNPSRRATSTATNPSTLVNHPGTVNTGPATNSGGVQSASVVQDRSYHQSTLAPDRRPSVFYDPIRGEGVIQGHLSDDDDLDRRFPLRRVSVPRPLPIFSPSQDTNGNRDGSGSRGISGLDWNADNQQFHEPQRPGPKTVGERLDATQKAATAEQAKYKKKAGQQSLLINGAIGLQVIVGAITTGVAAGSKNIGSAVAVLGGISTALASYLAKARGSGEPEFSTLRARELSTFLREVDAFIMDHGYKIGPEFDPYIAMYRERFELIIKTEGENSTSGTGYATNNRPNHPHPTSYQTMPGSFGGGRNFQAMPPHADGGNGLLSEKQQMSKNEKALSGMA